MTRDSYPDHILTVEADDQFASRVTAKSTIDGSVSTQTMQATREQIESHFESNNLIQNSLPQLTENDREFLMTGITQEVWQDLFGDLLGEDN